MIVTLRKNFADITKRETKKAQLSCTVQRRIGHPLDRRFKEIVRLGKNGLQNCPIEAADIDNSNLICGPHQSRLKGSTVWVKEQRTKEQKINIHWYFYRIHKFVTITADVMFTSGIPFLVNFSRKIKFGTAEFVPNRSARMLANSLRKVLMIYARGGFVVNLALMDKGFDKIKDIIPFLEVNTTAAREHVGEIKQYLREVQERVRCTTSDFPFWFIPTIVIIYNVYNCIRGLNAFPT